MTTSQPDGDPRFWDGIAETYAARPIQDVASYEHTLARTRAHIAGRERALELGCGTGATALRLVDCVGAYTASDASPAMLEIARGRARAEGRDDLRFVQAALAEFAPADGLYDAVLAFSFFHLLDDLNASVARAAALLAPGGVMVSKTICLAEMNPVFRVIVPVMRLVGKAPRVRFVTGHQVEAAMRAAGLEILEMGTFPKSPPAHFIAARKPD